MFRPVCKTFKFNNQVLWSSSKAPSHHNYVPGRPSSLTTKHLAVIITDRFCVALFCSQANSRYSCYMWFWMKRCTDSLSGCCTAGATWNCCCFGASSVYTIQPCTSLQCHFIQSNTGSVHVCLAVTCHLHFWHNDQDLLHATAVTWGWNRYSN